MTFILKLIIKLLRFINQLKKNIFSFITICMLNTRLLFGKIRIDLMKYIVDLMPTYNKTKDIDFYI